MDPEIWGPGAWLFLHSITLNYPNSPTQVDKKIHSDFFNLLGKVLPCSTCKQHYQSNNNNLPVQFNLQSKETLVKWLIEIHNKVNKMKNKPIINYDEFIKIYKDLYKNKHESITYYKNKNILQKKIIYSLLLIIVILLLISYWYIKLKRKI